MLGCHAKKNSLTVLSGVGCQDQEGGHTPPSTQGRSKSWKRGGGVSRKNHTHTPNKIPHTPKEEISLRVRMGSPLLEDGFTPLMKPRFASLEAPAAGSEFAPSGGGQSTPSGGKFTP